MSNQIHEFSNLKYLTLNYQAQIRLNDFDSLLERCPGLVTLEASVFPLFRQETIKEPNLMINPHHIIHNFECYWHFIDSEYQLRYLEQKFPNLRSLKVKFGGEYLGPIHDLSASTIKKFLHYVLPIPKFEINMEINQLHLMDVWNELVEIDAAYLNVALDYEKMYYANTRNVLKLDKKNRHKICNR